MIYKKLIYLFTCGVRAMKEENNIPNIINEDIIEKTKAIKKDKYKFKNGKRILKREKKINTDFKYFKTLDSMYEYDKIKEDLKKTYGVLINEENFSEEEQGIKVFSCIREFRIDDEFIVDHMNEIVDFLNGDEKKGIANLFCYNFTGITGIITEKYKIKNLKNHFTKFIEQHITPKYFNIYDVFPEESNVEEESIQENDITKVTFEENKDYEDYFHYISKNIGVIIYGGKNKIKEILNNNLIINKKQELQSYFEKLIKEDMENNKDIIAHKYIHIKNKVKESNYFEGSFYPLSPKNSLSYKAWFDDIAKNIGEIVYKHKKRIVENKYIGIVDLLNEFNGRIYYAFNDFNSQTTSKEEINYDYTDDKDFSEVNDRSLYSVESINCGFQGNIYETGNTYIAVEKLENNNLKVKYIRNELLRRVDMYEVLLADKRVKNEKDFNKILNAGNRKNNILHINNLYSHYSEYEETSPYRINFIYEVLYDKDYKILENKKYIEDLNVDLDNIKNKKEYENINYSLDGNFDFLHRLSEKMETNLKENKNNS